MDNKMNNIENDNYKTPNKKQKKFHENEKDNEIDNEIIDYRNMFVHEKNYVLEFIPKTLQITRQNASLNI